MTDFRVSVIIPVWNGEVYLGETIESALAQTVSPHEVIVVDDGSTDGSAAVAEGYRDAGPVTVVRQENRGHPAALNRGIEASSGDFLGFLDADDLWFEPKLERQLECFAADPDLDYCVTGLRNFISPDRATADCLLDAKLLAPQRGYGVQTLLARRRAFDRVGLFEPELRHAAKTSWFLRARDAGARGAEIEEVLVHRRLHGENISQSQRGESLDEYLTLLKARLDRRRKEATGGPES